MSSHLASLDREACRWGGSAGSTSGLLAQRVQNGTVRTRLHPHTASNRCSSQSRRHCFLLNSTKIFIRHPRTLYATEDAFEKCKHELGEWESVLVLGINAQIKIEKDGPHLQQRDSRPSTKDTERTVNSENRKKQVKVTEWRCHHESCRLFISAEDTSRFFSVFSHKDRILLARSAGQEGEGEESLGCQGHPTVRDQDQAGHHNSLPTLLVRLSLTFSKNLRFIKGYMSRGQAKTSDNSEYLAFVRQNYLNRLRNNLPKTVLDKTTWLPAPAVLAEVRIRPHSQENHTRPLST